VIVNSCSKSWQLSTPTVIWVSSYVLKRPYSWDEVPAKLNQAIDYGCNWNDGDVL